MLYKLSPQYKKSAFDVENWFKEVDGKKMWIEREYGWRWAHCTFKTNEPINLDLKNPDGLNIFEDIEAEDYEADDGCWSDYRYSENIDEEYRTQLDEMDFEDLENDGWELKYIDTYFTGPLVLEDEHGNISYGAPSER